MQISTYRSTIVAIFVSLALAGCDRNQSQTPQQSTINQTPSAHSQTKALRAASAVGYDGKQLQKQVDRVWSRNKSATEIWRKHSMIPARNDRSLFRYAN